MKRILIVACLVAVTIPAASANEQRARVLLQAAEAKVKVEGDLQAALTLYREAEKEAGSNRVLVAQTLVKMAEVYRSVNEAEALRIYERLVKEFSDQKDALTTARNYLAGRPAPGPLRDRVVASDDLWGDGRISPDGRFISYIDYSGPVQFMVRDLVTGTRRPVAGCGAASAFSPDGKQLVCGGAAGVSIVPVSGGTPARRIYANADVEMFFPVDWSADGTSIAVIARRKDRTRQIAVLAISDGALRVLKTVGWRGPDKMFFSPDGRYLAYDLPAGDNETQRDVFVSAVDGSDERVVVQDPSQDVIMAWAPDGRSLLFASDRNGPVGLWALPVNDGKPSGSPPTLLKADIGSAGSQGLTRSGTLYVVKGTSTVHFRVAPIDLAQGKLTGDAVAQVYGADTPAWSPDGTRLAYMYRRPSGLAVLAIRTLESGSVRELTPRLLYMPQPAWFPDGRSLAVWGRDLNGRGVIVRIDAETGAETFITEAYDIQQVQVSSDGTKIFYSDDNYRGPQATNPGVFERDLVTGTVRKVTASERQSPNGETLAGIVVDEKTKTSTLLIAPGTGAEPRRVTVPAMVDTFRGLSWTPDKRAVLVAGPDDSGTKSLWLVPMVGGAPRKLEIDISDWSVILGIRLSPNGKHIAFFTGREAQELWALENVVPGTK
jgi:Tol biopolymer transport system component